MSASILKTVQQGLVKNAPMILTVVGALGTVATAVLASESALKAEKLIEEAENPSKADKALIYAEAYAPPVAIVAASLMCIFGANHVNHQRIAALAGAYILSETAFEEYKEKAEEMLGSKKVQQIKDEVIQKHVDENQPNMDNVYMTPNEPNAGALWFDETSQRYFHSSGDRLRKIENEANKILQKDGWVSLNDIYDLIGIPGIKLGDNLGWSTSMNSDVDMHIGGALTEGDQPCGTICLDPKPSSWWFSELA